MSSSELVGARLIVLGREITVLDGLLVDSKHVTQDRDTRFFVYSCLFIM